MLFCRIVPRYSAMLRTVLIVTNLNQSLLAVLTYHHTLRPDKNTCTCTYNQKYFLKRPNWFWTKTPIGKLRKLKNVAEIKWRHAVFAIFDWLRGCVYLHTYLIVFASVTSDKFVVVYAQFMPDLYPPDDDSHT